MKISRIGNLGRAGLVAGGLATGMSACTDTGQTAMMEGIIKEVRASDSVRFEGKIDSVSRNWANWTDTLLESSLNEQRKSILDSVASAPAQPKVRTYNIPWKQTTLPTKYIDTVSQKSFEAGLAAGKLMQEAKSMDDSLKASSYEPDTAKAKAVKAIVAVEEVVSDTVNAVVDGAKAVKSESAAVVLDGSLKRFAIDAIADTAAHVK